MYPAEMFNRLKDIMDFDELIFENRNKDYGAFQLRKKYKRTVIAGTIISSLFVIIVITLPFALSLRPENERVVGMSYYSVGMEGLEPPPDDMFYIPPPPPPPPQGSTLVQEAVRYVPPVVIDSVLPIEEKMATTDEVLMQTTVDNFVIGGTGSGDGDIYSSGIGGIESDDPFFFVEVMPSFRGGDINRFREWVQRRTTYPQEAIDAKIQGKVFLTFIVEQDGSVTNVTVVKGVAPIIDNEAVSAIQSSPKWSPGLQRGQAVRVRFALWLNFAF